jgi:hypothetical protein
VAIHNRRENAAPVDPSQHPAYATVEFYDQQEARVRAAEELEVQVRNGPNPDRDGGRLRRLHNAKSRQNARDGGMAFPPYAEDLPENSPYYFAVVPPPGTTFASAEEALHARVTALDMREVGIQYQSELWQRRAAEQNSVADEQEALGHELETQTRELQQLRAQPREDLQFREGRLSVNEEHATHRTAVFNEEVLAKEKELADREAAVLAREQSMEPPIAPVAHSSVERPSAPVDQLPSMGGRGSSAAEAQPRNAALVAALQRVENDDAQARQDREQLNLAAEEDRELLVQRHRAAEVVLARRRVEDDDTRLQQDRDHLNLAIAASELAFSTTRKRRLEDAERAQEIATEDHNTRVLRAHNRRIRARDLLEAAHKQRNDDANAEHKDDC